MKLGISINYFPDCQQFINDCIASASGLCDHLTVVYSLQSNNGKVKFKSHGISHHTPAELYEYEPEPTLGEHQNEIRKRNLGWLFAQHAKCTHFLSMDADEFYNWTQFRAAVNQIKHHKWPVTAVPLLTYYGNVNHQYAIPEPYFVPFIFEIDRGPFVLSTRWPLTADPTRKVQAKEVNVPVNIHMHHYSYVRDNIRLKLQCSSASRNWPPSVIEAVVKHYENWQPGQDGLIAQKGKAVAVKLRRVD